MRFELCFLLSLACLAFTAQAAPSSAKNALLEQKLEQRSGQGEQHQSKDSRQRHHHQQKHHRARANQKRNVPQAGLRTAEEAASHLVPQEHLLSDLNAEIAGVENARRMQSKNKKHVMQVEDSIHIAKTGKSPPKFPVITRIGSFIGLTSAVLNVFNFLFAAKTTALATTQFSAPPTPPTLIDTPARWDGHEYTMMPLPKDVSEDDNSSKKERRSLADKAQPHVHAHEHLKKRSLAEGPGSSSRKPERMIKRRKSHLPAEDDKTPQMEKRWLIAGAVGLAAGAALAPGLPSMVTGKWKPEVDKPPFDPYDPNMLEPKDAFSAAAASPDQPLPAVPLQASPASNFANEAPNLDHIRFPDSAYTSLITSNGQEQPLVDPSSLQGVGSSYAGSGSAGSAAAQSQAVLRKRAVVSEAKNSDGHHAAAASSPLDKRFMLNGPWGKAAMLITAGSILPLVYGGVTHARYRTYNPRDRDILKDLDDTPTYGAVGVPGRQPGQLATNAMPGYTDYVAQLENQQAQQQAQALAAAQRQRLAAKEAEMREFQQNSAAQAAGTDTAGGAQSSEPVLRRRDTDVPQGDDQGFVSPDKAQSRLEKRGFGKLAAGLAIFGGILGYVQSATQFPQDRDEDKDAKKREMKKQQEAQMTAMQQQGAMQGGQPGGGYPSDPSAMSAGGAPPSTDPGSTSPYTFAYPPADSSTAPALGGGGTFSPSASTGAGVGLTSAYSDLGASGQGGGGSGSYSTFGSGAGSAGGSSSLGASLNAAAGYQASSGSQAGSNMLRKRDVLPDGDKAVSAMHDLEAHPLSKRTPGFGKALGIAGTTMFLGTLVGNLFVAGKQKSKPVPLVTPNANTKGPMIIGGEMYTSYLESKRGQMAGSGQGAVGSGLDLSTGTPASINYAATSPSYASLSNAGEASLLNSVSAPINPGTTPLENSAPYSSSLQQSSTGSGDAAPVLKKRSMVAPADALVKRDPLAWAVEAETAAASLASKAPALLEAESGAASLLSKAPAVSEAGAGAAGSAGGLGGLRGYSEAAGSLTRGGTYASEASLGGLGRSSLMAEGGGASVFRPNPAAWGSARPATVSGLRDTGSAGAPATLEGISGGLGRSTASSGMGYRQLTPQEILEVEQRAAGSAAAADKGLAAGESAEGGKTKGMSMGKALGIVGAGAGATMMFNGIG